MRDDNWFLYLTFNAVHTPMNATDKYLARFKDVSDERRRTYCGDDVGDGRRDWRRAEKASTRTGSPTTR